MINDLKKNVTKKNIFAMIIFSAIIMVFVFFGFQGTGGSFVGYAARVNSKVITLRDLQAASDRLSQFYASFMGGQDANKEMFAMQIRSSALNQLIQREVLLQGAKSAGFTASDVEVADFIRGVPQFQKEGVFQRSIYQSFVDAQGVSTTRFEDQIRDDIILNRLQTLSQESFTPFQSEVSKVLKLREKTYTLNFVNLKNINFSKSLTASDNEAKEFLANKDNQLKVQLEFENNKESYKDQKLEAVQMDIAKKLIKDEKGEVLLSEMEGSAQNPAQVESLLKKYGAAWSQTAPASLDAEQIPEIGVSDRLSVELVKLDKPGQIIPEVMRTSKGDFIVKLKSIDTKKLDAKEVQSLDKQLQAQRSNEMFDKWTDKLSKKYTIERNEALFKQ